MIRSILKQNLSKQTNSIYITGLKNQIYLQQKYSNNTNNINNKKINQISNVRNLQFSLVNTFSKQNQSRNNSNLIIDEQKENFVDESLQKKYNAKYTKNKAIKDVVEQMYFPDHAEISQKEALKEISKEYEQKYQGTDFSEKIQISQMDANEILSLGSSAKSQNQKDFYQQPEEKEDIIPCIENIQNNDHLLAFYLKYNKLFGKTQIISLLQKIQDNLYNEEGIRKRQIDQFMKKREKLQKLNNSVELQFNKNYIDKEAILAHDGFSHIQKSINHKIIGYLSSRASTHLMFKLFQFTKKIDKELLKTFIKKIHQDLDTLDVFPLMQILRMLTFYTELQMEAKQARLLQIEVQIALEKQNDKVFNNITSLTLMRSMYQNSRKPVTHPPLFAKIEPVVLRNLSLYNFKQVSDIFLCYYYHQQGGPQFYNYIIMDMYRKVENMQSTHNGVQLLSIAKKQQITIDSTAYSLQVLYEPLLKKLIQLIPSSRFTPNQLNTIISSITQNNINNQLYYQIIATEFLKNIQRFSVKKFSNCYFWITMSGIHSRPLLVLGLKKLDQELATQEESILKKPIGFLENKQTESNKLGASDQDQQMENKQSYNPLSYEDQVLQQIVHFLKIMWSIVYQITRESHEAQYIVTQNDYDILNRNVYIINDLFNKLNNFKYQKQVSFKRFYLELIFQINTFIKKDCHGLVPTGLDVDLITQNPSIKLQHIQYSEPKPDDLALFLLEKRLFFLKYSDYTQRDPILKDHVFHWRIYNPENNIETHFNINEFSIFTGSNANGLVYMRNYQIQREKIPYKNIEILDFVSFLDNDNEFLDEDTTYFEHIFSENNLPTIDQSFENAENKETLLNLKEEIMNLRKSIYLQKGRVQMIHSKLHNSNNTNKNQQQYNDQNQENNQQNNNDNGTNQQYTTSLNSNNINNEDITNNKNKSNNNTNSKNNNNSNDDDEDIDLEFDGLIDDGFNPNQDANNHGGIISEYELSDNEKK